MTLALICLVASLIVKPYCCKVSLMSSIHHFIGLPFALKPFASSLQALYSKQLMDILWRSPNNFICCLLINCRTCSIPSFFLMLLLRCLSCKDTPVAPLKHLILVITNLRWVVVVELHYCAHVALISSRLIFKECWRKDTVYYIQNSSRLIDGDALNGRGWIEDNGWKHLTIDCLRFS
jgi:hypothetical protein